MSRRFRFFTIIAVAAIGTSLAAVGGWRYARASAPVNGPIILISVDTLRADHLSPYGYRNARTPAIDALAADGIVFERAYTHATETLPAHVSMLSGRLPFETGVRGDDGRVGEQERLLPRLLHDRGYATAGITSSSVLGRDTGVPDSFDFFDGTRTASEPPNTATAGQVRDPVPAARRSGLDAEQVAEHWLDLQGSQRLFLFLHLYDVHRPYPAAEDADDTERYDFQVARADDAIGRLVRWLKQHQLYDRATIVLTADHGEGLGDHGEQEHGLFAYDETVHVPLIVKQAAANSGGRRIATPVQVIDIVPTVLDLVRAPLSGNLRGRSLKPVLEGQATLPHQPIYSEARYGKRLFGWAPIATVTDGRYRYIAAPREELYDLTTDPAEQKNLIAAKSDIAASLRSALKSIAGSASRAGDVRQPVKTPLPGGAELVQTVPSLDPKDGVAIAEAYRRNVELGIEGRSTEALAGLRTMAAAHPELGALWRQIAELSARIGRDTEAADAYEHLVALEPEDVGAHIGNAAVLAKLHRLADAKAEGERGAALAPARGPARLTARMLLVSIALESGDGEEARAQAALAQKLDPTVPTTAYVDARLLYDAGDYEAAAAAFERAIAASRSSERPIPDLHYYAGDTLVRLERQDEGTAELAEELRAFPLNTRARLALATLYQSMGRGDDAAAVVAELLRIAPTADNYAQVAKLWTSLGNRRQADAVRAEARRTSPAAKRH